MSRRPSVGPWSWGRPGRQDATMVLKTMRVTGERRTSIKLEPEFWGYLQEVADSRGVHLPTLVREIAAIAAGRTNLASALRVFALAHARRTAAERQTTEDRQVG